MLRTFVLLGGLQSLADQRAGWNGERSLRRFGGKWKRRPRVSWQEALRNGKGVVGTVGNVEAILEDVLQDAPPPEVKAVLEWVFSCRGLYLYVQ